MSGPRARALLLGAGALLLGLAATAAAEESSPAAPAAAAWYPSGVGAVTAPTYAEGTLHVGALAGQETDRTYLRFEPALPEGASVDGVSVRVRVDPDAGTSSPETAAILGCAVPGGFEPESAEPADVDCDGAREAVFADGVFTVDLEASADGIDVALVPTGGETWHVGFTDASAVVSYSVAAAVGTTTTAAPSPIPSAPSRPAVGGPIALPPITVPAPSAAGQAIADQAALPAPVVAAAGEDTSGFRYAGVFALPLALMLIVGVAGDGLTRPVRVRKAAT
jgi:hypothetical protein